MFRNKDFKCNYDFVVVLKEWLIYMSLCWTIYARTYIEIMQIEAEIVGDLKKQS